VQGFVSAAEQHFVRQASAEVHRFGAVTTLQYGNEVEHPWPRTLRFKLELLAEEGATAAEIDRVYRYVAVETQVESLRHAGHDQAPLVRLLADIRLVSGGHGR